MEEYLREEEATEASIPEEYEGGNGTLDKMNLILSEFESSEFSRLSVDKTKSYESTAEEETLTKPTPRKRGRPRKSAAPLNASAPPKVPKNAALLNEVLEQAVEVNLTQQDLQKQRWEEEKKDTIEKLSMRATRELDQQMREAKKTQAKQAKEAFEKGYEQALSEEELATKTNLLQQIKMYYRYYENLEATNERRSKWSLKTSIKDLQDEVTRCQDTLKMDRAYHTMGQLDVFFNYFIETVGIKAFGVPCHGLAAEAKQSQFIVEEEIKELSIKYHEYLDMGPETRYLLRVAQRFNTVLERNRSMMARGMSPVNAAEQESNLQNKYSEL